MKMLFSIQKSLIAAAIMLVAVVYSTQTCLYCRRMDVNAGFLVSYSYCNATDECVQDQWNYINRPCNDDWQLGKNLDLAKCNALPVACIDFESTPEKATQYFNRTWTLPVQSYCTIKVDANQEVARVVFDSTSFLGVELDDY